MRGGAAVTDRKGASDTMNPFEMAILMVYHPSDAFDEIKLKGKRQPVWPGAVILLAMIVMRYLYVVLVHRPLADIELQDTNLLLEVGRILLPVLTLVVSLYAVQSILYGETTIRMIFSTVTYSLVPYLILTPVLIGLSHLFSREEAAYYGAVNALMWAWIVLLVFVSIMYMNNFSFKKTVLVFILSLIGGLLIWGVAIMAIAMTIQLIGFINELYREYIIYNI